MALCESCTEAHRFTAAAAEPDQTQFRSLTKLEELGVAEAPVQPNTAQLPKTVSGSY